MLNYQIIGDDMQSVVIDLKPQQMIRAEAGAMTMMTHDIHMDAHLGGSGDGLLGGLMKGIKRVMAGDSLFISTFEAKSAPGQVIFSAPYPGKIIPLDLSESGDMLCQRESYLCSDVSVEISVAFTRRLGAGFFGGEGFILQHLSGSGMAFIHAGGMIISRDLKPNETLFVDSGCLVAFTQSVDYDIQMVKGIKSILFGGEGLFLARLTGPGRVYIQSLPFSRMANRILSASHIGGNHNGEEANPLSSLGGSLVENLFSPGD